MVRLSFNNENKYCDLKNALEENEVYGSASIKQILATIDGINDELDWHWLVELDNGKIGYIVGGCDYTGWDCQSDCQMVSEFDSLDEALSNFGVPTQEVNGHRVIRYEFKNLLGV